jgi:DHA1 family tetracycline resistance protein-like MFS transporter
LYAVLPLIPVAQGLTSPNLSALISNSAPRHLQGETLGMQQSVQSLAQLIPPIIGGFVVALTIDIPMWLAAACALLSWLVFIFGYWKKHKPKKETHKQGSPQHRSLP